MSDQDEEFENSLAAINDGKENFSENEQSIIDGWVAKLSEENDTEDWKTLRNEYSRTLARLVTKEKQLLPPFTEMPPDGDLTPLAELGGSEQKPKFPFQIKKIPCPVPRKSQTGAIPKPKKVQRNEQIEPFFYNEYEDPEEMAKAIARSKGQSFSEFVASISRHTKDFGQALHEAMKVETSSFRDYVDNVLSQRIKDLTEVLDEEQNRELQRIKKDIDTWQLELANVKRRIKEIIPDFDLEAYKKDKNYLKKLFTLDPPTGSLDDSFKRWKEETCHRLKWISDVTCRVMRSNEQTLQEIEFVNAEIRELEANDAARQQNHVKFLNCEISEYQRLKSERDCLNRGNKELLQKLQELDM